MIDDDALTSIAATVLISKAEGWKDTLYEDPSGHPCIGYGFRLDQPHALSSAVGTIWLTQTLQRMFGEIAKSITYWNELPLGARAVLMDMAYQMGLSGLLRFKKMLKALKERDYETAAVELMDSDYAKQTPSRAQRNAKILRLIAQSAFFRSPCDPLADDQDPVNEKNVSRDQETPQ